MSNAAAGAGGAASPRRLHEFLDEPVRGWPDHLAVEVPAGEGRPYRSLTYRELAERAEALARRIAPQAGPERVVAVLLSRETPDLYVAQLGVGKVGAAYACIDPVLPDDYARFLIADTDAALVLTDAVGAARAAALGVEAARVLRVDDPALIAAPATGPLPMASPENLAYIIYTSGTTGRPKGVMIEHRSVANLVASDLREFGLGPGDRVSQNSSPSYDSSVEEIWLALAAGATLVVADDRVVRSGPDLAEWLRRERITVFCPPPTLLRTTGCREPERELPGVRLVYVGGEALTDDVAALWVRGRRLENGYGPTECTVTATRRQVEPGAPISIGWPIPGNQAWILNEAMQEMIDGEVGELCIGGLGLARGYRNLPELTAERFPTHPVLGRLYRTGDLVQRGADGELFFLGRRDAQVKVRGHRIELEAIEARLAEQPGVREAACGVQGEGARRSVVAFVVPDDLAAPPESEKLRKALAAILPAPMVPVRIGVLAALPTTVGGKLDRKRLPQLDLAAGTGGAVPSLSGVEAQLAESIRAVLGLAEVGGVDADFFVDLGGDSLAAAELVSRLRDLPATASLTVRDLYELRTVRALAERCQREPAASVVRREGAKKPTARGKPALATAIQCAWILGELLLAAALAQLVVWEVLPLVLEGLGLAGTVLLAPALGFAALLAWAPLAVAYAVAVKQLAIGRYRPQHAPAWGSFHLRHWAATRAARRIPWEWFAGTPLTCVALRALGAKVGRRVHIHRNVPVSGGGWDLLEIGDDATVAQDASLRMVEFSEGEIVVGTVRIGNGATLGTRSGVGRNVVVGEGAWLDALSWLEEGERVPDGARWDGVPARPVGRAPEPPAANGRAVSPAAYTVFQLASGAALRALRELPLAALTLLAAAMFGVDGATAAAWVCAPVFDVWLLGVILGLLVLRVPLALALDALIVRALSPAGPTVQPRWSYGYARLWLITTHVDLATRWLSGSLFWPPWLRLAGMRVGRNCEISTLIDLVPSLVEIGDESFLADGIYLGGPRVQAGRVTLARTSLGRNTFVGNHAMIPSGAQLPADVLIGVSTPADPGIVRKPGVWFGHPPFELARRPPVEFDRSVTHEPSLVRRVTRIIWEVLRFGLPVPVALLSLVWLGLADGLAAEGDGWRATGAFAVATLATSALAWLTVVALKWFLLGRVQPGRHPLWSCWCCRWDFLYVVWEQMALRVLAELEGTLVLNACLRAFGMRIGRVVLLGPGFAQVVDPDMLVFEDGATVNGNFQAHTFEDRVLKIGPVTIRRGASVGRHAVLFYGAEIGEEARVAPHGVVLKGERLSAGRHFTGVPTQPA